MELDAADTTFIISVFCRAFFPATCEEDERPIRTIKS